MSKLTGRASIPEGKSAPSFAEVGVSHLIATLEPLGVESIEQFGRIVELSHQE
jgi:hypothetical protein